MFLLRGRLIVYVTAFFLMIFIESSSVWRRVESVVWRYFKVFCSVLNHCLGQCPVGKQIHRLILIKDHVLYNTQTGDKFGQQGSWDKSEIGLLWLCLIIGWAMKRTFREFLQPDSFQNIFPIKVLLQQKTVSCIRNRFFIWNTIFFAYFWRLGRMFLYAA